MHSPKPPVVAGVAIWHLLLGLDILGRSTRLHAFKLIAEGKTRYIMVEQNKSLNGGKDYIYLWKQQRCK